MKTTKLSATKSMESVCKEIEEMIRNVLGTKPNKTKEDKAIVYYPARRFAGTDDMMDDIRIVVRKVNNSLTSIKLEDSEKRNNIDPLIKAMLGIEEDWRNPIANKVYNTLERVLIGMFPKQN